MLAAFPGSLPDLGGARALSGPSPRPCCGEEDPLLADDDPDAPEGCGDAWLAPGGADSVDGWWAGAGPGWEPAAEEPC